MSSCPSTDCVEIKSADLQSGHFPRPESFNTMELARIIKINNKPQNSLSISAYDNNPPANIDTNKNKPRYRPNSPTTAKNLLVFYIYILVYTMGCKYRIGLAAPRFLRCATLLPI